MLDRLMHWPSTIAGTALGAAVIYAFNSFGCKLPSDWLGWALGSGTALLGILFPRKT